MHHVEWVNVIYVASKVFVHSFLTRETNRHLNGPGAVLQRGGPRLGWHLGGGGWRHGVDTALHGAEQQGTLYTLVSLRGCSYIM